MKAILVTDMPNNCYECPIIQNGLDGYCPVGGGLIPFDKYNSRCVECPLKPMPKRMLEVLQIRNENIVNILNVSFANGWNACLDELLNTGLNYSKDGEELEK